MKTVTILVLALKFKEYHPPGSSAWRTATAYGMRKVLNIEPRMSTGDLVDLPVDPGSYKAVHVHRIRHILSKEGFTGGREGAYIDRRLVYLEGIAVPLLSDRIAADTLLSNLGFTPCKSPVGDSKQYTLEGFLGGEK